MVQLTPWHKTVGCIVIGFHTLTLKLTYFKWVYQDVPFPGNPNIVNLTEWQCFR